MQLRNKSLHNRDSTLSAREQLSEAPRPHPGLQYRDSSASSGKSQATVGKGSNSDSRNIKRENNACLAPPVPEESKTHTENTSRNTSQALLESGRSPSGHDPRRSPSHPCTTRQPNRLKSLLPSHLKTAATPTPEKRNTMYVPPTGNSP